MSENKETDTYGIKDIPCVMAVFGGTGDLTHRKLVPAIYNLAHQGQLPRSFAFVGVGRRDMTTPDYVSALRASAEKYSRSPVDGAVWSRLAGDMHYFRLDFTDGASYKGLKAFLNDIDRKKGTRGNRLFYLSTAPEYFEAIALSLKENGMAGSGASFKRLMIEKPFGNDIKTAQYLSGRLTEVFPDGSIFRIDHYLGKEMLQNILVIRFGNAMFESIWNSRHIDNIQITSAETVGVEGRALYYDSAGALRDMVQSHLLQLAALVGMEPPADPGAQSIRAEKIKLLKSLKRITGADLPSHAVRGQYAGYRNEAGIPPDSDTETFAALKLVIDNFRWAGTPFYIRTGKKLPEKTTRITIEFRSLPNVLYFKEYNGMMPNLLNISIHPKEGISFRFNTKKPGSINGITSAVMDFCHNCEYENNSPEAYERLIADAIRGDQTLFTSWEEIEEAWRFVDGITSAWKSEKPRFPDYAPGEWGPKEADALLERDGRHWWNI